PDRVIMVLEGATRRFVTDERAAQSSTYDPFSCLEQLRELLEYFARRHHLAPLSEEARTELRKLPLYVTTGGNLAVAAPENDDPLLRPAGDGRAQRDLPLDILGKDILIDPAMLGGNGREFLHTALEIEEITPLAALRDHVLPRYNDDDLSHND